MCLPARSREVEESDRDGDATAPPFNFASAQPPQLSPLSQAEPLFPTIVFSLRLDGRPLTFPDKMLLLFVWCWVDGSALTRRAVNRLFDLSTENDIYLNLSFKKAKKSIQN